MVTPVSLVSDLQAIAGEQHVLTGDDLLAFSVDGAPPATAVRPGSYQEAADILRYADSAGLAVIPWGGGTLMHLGNCPARYDIALSLSRLNAVVEHEPADLTVTVQAGITLRSLQRHLSDAGQLVPLDPSLPQSASVGGVLAAAAFGPSVHTYGMPRDFTIGVRVVTADGRLTRAGGRVVKNVAGYDLCKLYIGSLGTLGVIVEATFKTLPLPKAQAGLAVALADAGMAWQMASRLYAAGVTARAAQVFTADAVKAAGLNEDCLLTLEFAGTPLAVSRSLHEARQVAAKLGGRELKATKAAEKGSSQILAPAPDAAVARLAVLPSRLPALLAALSQQSGWPAVAYPLAGVVRVRLPAVAEALEKLAAAAREQAASLMIESCPADLKRQIDVLGELPSSFGLMRQVKQEFDPRGTLSPGRFVGRL